MHRRLGIVCLVAVIGASIAVLYAQTPDPGRGGVWVSGAAGQRAGSDGTFNTLTVTSTAADAIDVAGGLTAGSGNVAIIDTSGKLPALSATYLASLSGAALTSLDAGNISAGTLVVGRGGTGATTLTDGGVLLGSGTGAVTALAALSDGVIVIGDGSGDPTTLDVGASGGITILGTIATGVWNGTAVTAAYGGTGATSLTDGGVLLGSGTGAVTALAALGDGSIVIGDGSGDPTTLDVGSSTAITVLGTVATGTWQATDVGVAYGGTGVSTLTDGGILLGSGSAAISALAVLSDSQMIVGDGSGDPVAESGATLRTSIGVGTGDSLTFTGLTVSGTGASALDVGGGLNIGTGDVSLIGTDGKLSGPLSSTIIDDLSGANLTTLNASNLSSGTVATARLGSGTASSSTFLRGDSSWQTVSAGTPGGSDTQVQYNDGGSFGGDAGLVYVAGTDTLTLAGPLNVAGAAIFNDAGGDVDFRIESDDNANMLFVDGGEDRVGIGNNAPAALLNLKSTVPSIYLTSDGTQQANSGLIRFSEHATGVNDYFEITHNGSDNAFYITSNEAGTVLAIPRDTGNVGIGGVTVPGARLEIEDGGISHPGPLFISRQDDDDVWNMMLVNDSYSTTAVYGVRMTVATDGDFNIYGSDKTSSPGHISFFTDETQRMQIGSNGRLAYNLGDFNNVYGNIEVEGFGDDVGSGMYPDDADGHQLLNMGAGGGGDAARRGVLKIITTDDGANSSIAMGSVGGADVDFNFFTRRLNGLGAVNLRIKGDGSTEVTGAFSKASGSFKIPHPIWPATHDLVHSFVESSDTLLLYRGTATVDGTETIDLDAYLDLVDDTWDALTRDPQVWVSNASGWEQVRGTVTDGILTLETQDPTATGVEVNWLIAAERQDDHIKETNWTDDDGNPILELLKPLFSTVAPPTFEESVGDIYPDIEVEDTTPVAPERYPAFRFTDENGNTITEDETDEDII